MLLYSVNQASLLKLKKIIHFLCYSYSYKWVSKTFIFCGIYTSSIIPPGMEVFFLLFFFKPKSSYIFVPQNMLWYLLVVPHWGTSNEYP